MNPLAPSSQLAVPQSFAYPRLVIDGQRCKAVPKPPTSVELQFNDGSTRLMSLDEFRMLPREKHIVVRDEFWDDLGGNQMQNELSRYLYGDESTSPSAPPG